MMGWLIKIIFPTFKCLLVTISLNGIQNKLVGKKVEIFLYFWLLHSLHMHFWKISIFRKIKNFSHIKVTVPVVILHNHHAIRNMIKVINKLLVIMTKEGTMALFLSVGCFQLETFF